MYRLTIEYDGNGSITDHEMIWDCVNEIDNRLEVVADIDAEEISKITIENLEY